MVSPLRKLGAFSTNPSSVVVIRRLTTIMGNRMTTKLWVLQKAGNAFTYRKKNFPNLTHLYR